MAKAPFQVKIDAEKRRCGQKIGLDTPVSHTVNDEWQFSVIILVLKLTAITIPPCEYICKNENKKISRS